MKTRVLTDADAVAHAAVDLVASRAAVLPGIVMALPTGRTPIPFYAELRRRHELQTIDLRSARAFNLDELALARGDPRTFRAFMEIHAWEKIGLVRDRCEIPDGATGDLEWECHRYEEAIAAAGGIDLAIIGVGADGHVAYNLPGPVSLPTHVVRLPEGLAAALDVLPEAGPLRAITMGLGTLRAAREILLLATGATKAMAIEALRRGVHDPEWPCTFLAGHAELTALLDPAAASGLSRA